MGLATPQAGELLAEVISAAKPARREEALTHSMLSTHTILSAAGGQFISLIDPPAEYRQAASDCRNIGTFPVLACPEDRARIAAARDDVQRLAAAD